MDLEEVADALYAGPPDDFVRARDAAVREARDTGDRSLATQIGRLRKPTVGAWLANLLAHHQAADVARLLELGSALSEAQAQLDAVELRALSRRRGELVRELVGSARRLAAEHGAVAAGPALQELEGTFTAALTDPDAAALLASGRLTGGLSYAGFGGPAPLASATVTARATRGEPRREPATKTAPAAAKSPDVDDAERELAQARLQGAYADTQVTAAEQGVAAAEAELAALRERVSLLRADLAAAEQAAADQQAEVGAAKEEELEARAAVKASTRAVAAAEKRLARLLK